MVELIKGKGIDTILYVVSILVASFRFVKIIYLIVIKIEPILFEIEKKIKDVGKDEYNSR